MATKIPKANANPFQTVVERCDSCGRETDHRVSIELKTESTKRENARYSREPYRMTECLSCGDRSSVRMNNE